MSEPRHGCRAFFAEHKVEQPKQVAKADFDKLYDGEGFKVGPFRETFGDGYGEPYNPARQAFGITTSGDGVFCELHPPTERQP